MLVRLRARAVRLEDDLDAVVHVMLELLVTLRRVVQRHAVRDDEAGVNLVFLNKLQQRLQITLHVRLPGLHR